MSEQLNDSKNRMEKAIEHLRGDFSKMRVGRASASMVEGVKVEVYGSAMTLKEVAALNVPDAKTITIQPWDKGVIGEIEKGILESRRPTHLQYSIAALQWKHLTHFPKS